MCVCCGKFASISQCCREMHRLQYIYIHTHTHLKLPVNLSWKCCGSAGLSVTTIPARSSPLFTQRLQHSNKYAYLHMNVYICIFHSTHGEVNFFVIHCVESNSSAATAYRHCRLSQQPALPHFSSALSSVPSSTSRYSSTSQLFCDKQSLLVLPSFCFLFIFFFTRQHRPCRRLFS